MLLEVKDLVCKYGAATALKGVSCDVNEGEIVALVGANGAGKTTLLRTLSGLMRPAGGQISFNGKRIDGRRPHEILKLGVAHVPEGRMVIANMSVLDNLKMGAYLRRDLQADPDRHRGDVRALPGAQGPAHPEGRAASPAASSRCWRWPGRS